MERHSWLVVAVCAACAIAIAAGFTGIGPATAEEAETVTVIEMEGLDPRESSLAGTGSMGEVAFVAGMGTQQSIYYSAEGADGTWSAPIRISGNDTGDRMPDLAISSSGTTRGVAYVSWDPVHHYEIYFAEYVNGEWTQTRVSSDINKPGQPRLVYSGEEPHIVFGDDVEVWGQGHGPIYHAYTAASVWTVEEIEGPEATGEWAAEGHRVSIDAHDGSLAYAWTRVDVDEGNQRKLESRRVAVLGPEGDTPSVLLPNPNDTADHSPFLKIDENGRLRLLFQRGDGNLSSAVYAVQGASDWEITNVGAGSYALGFDYEGGVALCGFRGSEGQVAVSRYTDGAAEPVSYEYPEFAGRSTDLAMSAGQMWFAADMFADGVHYIEIRKRQVAEYEQPLDVIPIAGEGRYETAVAASVAAFPDGADTVVIATGRNWPDALGGSALAGTLEGPILLVTQGAVPEAVLGEIDRLEAANAVIIGGEVAVGADVATALETAGLTVERIAGGSRYETADLVAARVVEELDEDYDGTAFLATGASYADAVAAAPLAAAKGWPLFLAHPTSGITDEMRLAFDVIDRVLLLGGELAISAETEAAVAGYVDADGAVRLAGGSRYETAAKIATYGVESAGLSWDRVGIATGQAYPDALAGGVLQGKVGSVMLLTRSASLDEAAAEVLAANKGTISTVTFFGGEGAVSQAVRDAVAQALE